jgi:hypothetical protein
VDDRPAPQSPTPGERRLDRAPSDRYREPEPPPEAARPGTPARGIAFACVVAILGAIAIGVAGEVLTITAGLLVIAAVLGWAVAVAVRVGAGASLPKPGRTRAAVSIALAGIVLGQIFIWLISRAGGDVLSPIDYLGEAYGILVPLQLAVAALAAWLGAR